MKYHSSLYKHKSISLFLFVSYGWISCNFWLSLCIVFIKKICVSLPLSAPEVYCIYLKCFTDGPTGVWCVCRCACNYTEEAIITGRRLPRDSSSDVCEGTGHGRNLCKVNKNLFISSGRFATVFILTSLKRGRSQRGPCCAGDPSVFLWRRTQRIENTREGNSCNSTHEATAATNVVNMIQNHPGCSHINDFS